MNRTKENHDHENDERPDAFEAANRRAIAELSAEGEGPEPDDALAGDEPGSYARRQDAEHAHYLAEYRAWISGLSDEELAQVKELGLAEPLPPVAAPALNVVGVNEELLGAWAEPGGHGDAPPPPPVPREIRRMIACETIRIIAGELLKAPNARLSLECLAIASGVVYTGCTITEVARKHIVTKSAVSKRCVEFCDWFGLPPTRAMRSYAARDAYSEAQLDSAANNPAKKNKKTTCAD